MTKSYLVYVHTAPNGKRYVGQTCKKPNARWRNGEGYRLHHPHFYAAIQKYGWSSFEHKIVAEGLTKNEADATEAELIREYMSDDRRYGYNVERASRGPGKHSEATKAKISAANMGRTVTDETRRKISEKLKGRKPPPKTDAGRRALVEFNTGRHPTKETREKLRKARLGYVWSDESKEKMRQALKGRLCEWCRIGVQQIDKETGAVIDTYSCTKDAERATGIASTNISAVCKGKRKTAGGFKWAYKEGEHHN